MLTIAKKTIVLLLFSTSALAATSAIDSLQSRLASARGEEKLAILTSLEKLIVRSDARKALVYVQEALHLARALGDRKAEGELLSDLGFAYANLSEFSKALDCTQAALELSTTLGNKTGIANAHSIMGTSYGFIGQNSKALEHHLTALKLREELNVPIDIARSLNNIGIIYHNLGRYDKAIEYYQRALEYRRTAHDTAGMVRSMHNLGFSEYKRGRFNEAMKIHSEALIFSKQIQNTDAEAYSLFNIGLVYSGKKEYKEALEHLNRSYKIYSSSPQTYGTAQVLNALGAAYADVGNRTEAVACLEKAIKLASEVKATDQLLISYEAFFKLYEKSGNAEKAYQYYKLYTNAKDTIFSRSETGRITDLTVEYEKEKRERTIELLKKEGTITNLTLDKQQYQINLLIAGIVVLVLLIVLLLIHSHFTRKHRRFVEQQKTEVEKLYRELKEKTDQVKILGGLIPICSCCKKIRDDKGYWEQLEGYLSKHSEATFTHSVCPDCFKELYPNFVSSGAPPVENV